MTGVTLDDLRPGMAVHFEAQDCCLVVVHEGVVRKVTDEGWPTHRVEFEDGTVVKCSHADICIAAAD